MWRTATAGLVSVIRLSTRVQPGHSTDPDGSCRRRTSVPLSSRTWRRMASKGAPDVTFQLRYGVALAHDAWVPTLMAAPGWSGGDLGMVVVVASVVLVVLLLDDGGTDDELLDDGGTDDELLDDGGTDDELL